MGVGLGVGDGEGDGEGDGLGVIGGGDASAGGGSVGLGVGEPHPEFGQVSVSWNMSVGHAALPGPGRKMASRSPSSTSRAASAVNLKLLAAVPPLMVARAVIVVFGAGVLGAVGGDPLARLRGLPTGLTMIRPVQGNMRVTVPWSRPQAEVAGLDASAKDAYITDAVAVW